MPVTAGDKHMTNALGQQRYYCRQGGSHLAADASIDVLRVNDGEPGSAKIRFENNLYFTYSENAPVREYKTLIA